MKQTKLEYDCIKETIERRQNNDSITNTKTNTKSEIAEMKNEIKDLKNTIKELVDMMKSVYEFEDVKNGRFKCAKV
jgi:uncharacterized coiled-coil DUF342 family protein